MCHGHGYFLGFALLFRVGLGLGLRSLFRFIVLVRIRSCSGLGLVLGFTCGLDFVQWLCLGLF